MANHSVTLLPQRHALRAIDVPIPPPTAHTFSDRLFCPPNPCPISADAISQKIEHLIERHLPFFSTTHLQHPFTLGFVRTRPLGSMPNSMNSSMMSFTIHVSLSLWSRNIQGLSTHTILLNRYSLSSPHRNAIPHTTLAFHFRSSFHHTYLATELEPARCPALP